MPPPIEKGDSPLTLKQLLDDVRKSSRYLSILRTAAQLGWFCNGTFLTVLNTDEENYCRKRAAKHHSIGQIPFLPVGEMLNVSKYTELKPAFTYQADTDYPYQPAMVRFNEKKRHRGFCYVATWVYATLCERHPLAKWFSTSWCPDDDAPLVVVLNNRIVAVTMPFNIV